MNQTITEALDDLESLLSTYCIMRFNLTTTGEAEIDRETERYRASIERLRNALEPQL